MVMIRDLSDIPQLQPVDDGEYHLRVIHVKDVVSKGDEAAGKKPRNGIQLTYKIEGVENADNVFNRLWFPLPDDEDSKKGMMWRIFQDAAEAHGLPREGGFDTSEFLHTEVDAYLVKVENQGRMINEIKRYI